MTALPSYAPCVARTASTGLNSAAPTTATILSLIHIYEESGEPARNDRQRDMRWVHKSSLATLEWMPADIELVNMLVRMGEEEEQALVKPVSYTHLPLPVGTGNANSNVMGLQVMKESDYNRYRAFRGLGEVDLGSDGYLLCLLYTSRCV